MSDSLSVSTDHSLRSVLESLYDCSDEDYTIDYSESGQTFVGSGAFVAFCEATKFQLLMEIESTVKIWIPDHDEIFRFTVMRWFSLYEVDAYCLSGHATWIMQIDGELGVSVDFEDDVDYSELNRPFEFAQLPRI